MHYSEIRSSSGMTIENIHVYGLGALGSNVLLQLVRQFPGLKYAGVDFDKVEDRNIRIQAFYLEHIGQPKAFALRTVLLRYVRKLDYKPLQKKIVEQIPLPDDKTLVIDCFDNVESRKLLRGHPNILHLGFSPFYSAEMFWDDSYDMPGPVDPTAPDICQLQDAVSFIHYFVNLAVLSVATFVNEGVRENFFVTNRTKVTRLEQISSMQ